MTTHDPKLDDFRNVLYLVIRQLLNRDPTPVQYDIASYLQHGPRRSIIEAFRGVGKSWIASIFCVDELRKNPQLNILVVSASKERADQFSTFCRRLIDEVPIFKHMAPRKGQRDAVIAFDVAQAGVSHAPSLKSVGLYGQMAGSRADLIIPDDVEVPGNSMTQLMRDRLSEAVKEFDAILKPNGRIRLLGTPQTEQTIYTELQQRGYECRIWPARIPTSEELTLYGERIAPFVREMATLEPAKAGHTSDPQRFTDLDLLEREASYGRSGFRLQFMLDTRLSDALRYPLKLSDLCVMDLDPDLGPERVVWARSPELELRNVECVGLNGDRFYRPMRIDGKFIPYTNSVLAVDPSGRGADETGIAVVKALNSQLFVPVCRGLAGGYDEETLRTIALTAKEQKVNRILVEANFGDGMFVQLLKPVLGAIWPCTIEEVRHNLQKEKRIIDTLEPVMNSHRLVVATRVIEGDSQVAPGIAPEHALTYRLFHQMSRITRDRASLKHDDRLDALAIGVAYHVERMNLAVGDEMKRRQEEFEEKARKDFVDGILGKGKDADTWLSRGMPHLDRDRRERPKGWPGT